MKLFKISLMSLVLLLCFTIQVRADSWTGNRSKIVFENEKGRVVYHNPENLDKDHNGNRLRREYAKDIARLLEPLVKGEEKESKVFKVQGDYHISIKALNVLKQCIMVLDNKEEIEVSWDKNENMQIRFVKGARR